MKKLFTMLVATVCATMAYAQEVTVKDVTMSAGETPNMEVSISNVNQYTAFQFDLALPTGFSVKNASLSGTTATTRKLEKALYDEATNKWRFLSYDEGNAKLAEGTTVNITLEAADGAEGGDVAGSDILVVTPEAVSTAQASASAKITISGDVSIEIPAGGKLAMVCSKDLDFTTLEAQGVTAYICTGYQVADETFWLMRVNDVPANTPVLVKGVAGVYSVPTGMAGIYYPSNFLVGNAASTFDVDKSEGYINYAVSKTKGTIGTFSLSSLEAGKAYFHVPSSVSSAVSENKISFTMGKAGKLACVSEYDLDFTDVEGLSAYAVTAFDKTRTIWLMPVSKVSAGTPLLLRGASEGTYEVPSSATQMAYINMLNGNISGAAMNIDPVMGENTIYALSLSKGVFGTLAKTTSFANGKAWLPIPTAFHTALPASSRGMSNEGFVSEKVGEFISYKAIGGEDDNATGISRVAAEAGNDTWYNLNGQRIDTPTKKGLYIKNGKKVIVK